MKMNCEAPLVEVPSPGVLSPALKAKLAKTANSFIALRLNGQARTAAACVGKLEQYYTSARFAMCMRYFVDSYFPLDDYLTLEPSAGDATIADVLSYDSIAMDVDPKFHTVIKANFLATRITTNRPIAVVGNPPFKLAAEFFNHAAEQAEVIAMIFPLTFRRNSVQRQLNPYFHLVAEMDVPPWAFVCGGEPYNVPATLQIWERRTVERDIPAEITSHPDFSFGPSEQVAFAFQRIGVNAGLVHHNLRRSRDAHMLVTASRDDDRSYVKAMFNSIDWAAIASNTSAVPYLTASEIYAAYIELERVIRGRLTVNLKSESYQLT